jgi:hypothetical protein
MDARAKIADGAIRRTHMPSFLSFRIGLTISGQSKQEKYISVQVSSEPGTSQYQVRESRNHHSSRSQTSMETDNETSSETSNTQSKS